MSITHYEAGLRNWVAAILDGLYGLPQVVDAKLTKLDIWRYYRLVFTDLPTYADVKVETRAVPGDSLLTIRNRLAALVNADSRLPLASYPEGDAPLLRLSGRGVTAWAVAVGLSSSTSEAFDVDEDAFDLQVVAEAQPVQVIFAHEKGPRPGQPFVTLHCVTHQPTGQAEADIRAISGNEYDARWQSDQRYEGTCDVNFYGPDSARMMHSLQAARWAPLDPDPLEAAGVDVVDINTMATADEVDGSLWRHRSLAEIRFRYAYRVHATVQAVRIVNPEPSIPLGA